MEGPRLAQIFVVFASKTCRFDEILTKKKKISDFTPKWPKIDVQKRNKKPKFQTF